jgi:hypothetical protein
MHKSSALEQFGSLQMRTGAKQFDELITKTDPHDPMSPEDAFLKFTV